MNARAKNAARAKQRMSNKKFLWIWVPVLAVVTVITVVANVALVVAGGWVASQFGSGTYEFKGVDAIMRFLSESLGEERGSVTIHHGHHPEIELLSDTSARGTWALYNYMFNLKQNRGIRIGAYYDDTYVKQHGVWKFQHIGYQTLFHEEWKRDDIPSLQLVSG